MGRYGVRNSKFFVCIAGDCSPVIQKGQRVSGVSKCTSLLPERCRLCVGQISPFSLRLGNGHVTRLLLGDCYVDKL